MSKQTSDFQSFFVVPTSATHPDSPDRVAVMVEPPLRPLEPLLASGLSLAAIRELASMPQTNMTGVEYGKI